MSSRHDDYLLVRLKEVCDSSPAGVSPFFGKQLRNLAHRTSVRLEDHATFYLAFMEGIRDLLLSEEAIAILTPEGAEDADRILRHFMGHSLTSEARIHADDQEVRDHLTHVTQVFLIGWIVLNSCRIFQNDALRPYCWDSKELFKSLNLCWLFAALLHDCAYSVEYAKNTAKHEIAIRSIFGEGYEPGMPGGYQAGFLEKEARPLWEKRRRWRGLADFDLNTVSGLHKKQYDHPDHGLVGGIALWKALRLEEKHPEYKERISRILRPAAVAIACHNFQYLVKGATEQQQPWLRLSLKTEPISALLHICDELQEWGRERSDEAAIYKSVFKPVRYMSTELAQLGVHDFDGLALDVRLLRRLYPQHRPLRHRIVREQELKIADTEESFEKLFAPCKNEKSFDVRLRVRQTVDDQRCRKELRVNWDRSYPSILGQIYAEWQQRYRKQQSNNCLKAVSFAHEQKDKNGNVKYKVTLSTEHPFTTISASHPLRMAIVAAGGAGKSTLLQRIAFEHGPDKTRYLEQFPDELADITKELEAFQENAEYPALLIVDHLDRLAEDEHGFFWLEQLASAAKHLSRLNIILASRLEEYDRYFAGVLKAFDRALWTSWQPHLVSGGIDSLEEPQKSRRFRAEAIEKDIVGNARDLLSLAGRAAQMQQRRVLDVPAGITLEHAEFKNGTEIRNIIDTELTNLSGRARFLHDCIQDLFSAAHIADCLSKDSTNDVESDLIAIRRLERLPRDVPRLLFGILASREEKFLTRDQKKKAAHRIAIGFIAEPTIQQWLYDTGRLYQAFHGLTAYLENYSSIPEVRLVAHKFLGHAEYEQFIPSDLLSEDNEKLQAAERAGYGAFEHWVQSAVAAEQLLTTATGEHQKHRYQWFLAFLIDHIVLVLTKAPLEKAQRWINSCADVSALQQAGDPVQPGWIHTILSKFISATQAEVDDLYCAIDSDLTKFSSGGGNTVDANNAVGKSIRNLLNDVPWLEVRRAHIASHLGNHFLSEGFKASNPDFLRLDKAKPYFERSITRRERVLREMEREPRDLRSVEVFSTLSQGHADNAHQYRGIFEYSFWKHKNPSGRPAELALELIHEHRQQESNWARARLYRGPSERLPNMFRTSLPWLALGRALTEMTESGIVPNENKTPLALENAWAKLLDDYRREGEVHSRYKSDSLEDAFGRTGIDEVADAILKLGKAALAAERT